MKAICFKCRNFKNLDRFGYGWDIWYNHICLASEKRNEESPVTGTRSRYIEDRFKACRDVNEDGDCKLYDPRPTMRDVIDGWLLKLSDYLMRVMGSKK